MVSLANLSQYCLDFYKEVSLGHFYLCHVWNNFTIMDLSGNSHYVLYCPLWLIHDIELVLRLKNGDVFLLFLFWVEWRRRLIHYIILNLCYIIGWKLFLFSIYLVGRNSGLIDDIKLKSYCLTIVVLNFIILSRTK